jgi:hypothetical protein
MKKLIEILTFKKYFIVIWEAGGRSVPKSALAARWAVLHNNGSKISYEPPK